jgi:polyisoprenoid-binding protein YceI
MPHRNMHRAMNSTKRAALAALFCLAALPAPSEAQTVPVFQIPSEGSAIKFSVSSSVPVSGKFDKWNASLVFASADPTTGVLDIQIQAASVDTGSGLKDRKLKSDDFFDAGKNPLIKFHSTKIVQTAPNTADVEGDFTLRGVTKPEKLSLVISGAGTGAGTVTGTMAFNRKDYGVNGDIPFVRIADRVEVSVDLKVKRVSGPALTLTLKN